MRAIKHGHVFVAGCGDVGLRLARRCCASGAAVTGLVGSAAGAARLAAAGISAQLADLDAGLPALPDLSGSRIFYFVPPPKQGDDDPRLRHFLAAIPAAQRPHGLVYISTSGVYGDCGGDWVDESRPINPATPRARRRAAAEAIALDWGRARGLPVQILRVPGIYGPGRLPLARIRQRQPVLRPEDSPWSNRIHVEDLVDACLAAAERGAAGGIYNVSDGSPGRMSEYFDAVADWAGLPRPPRVTLAEAGHLLTPEMLSFLGESRRLDTRRLRAALGFTPRYPDLASGLAACGQPPSA